MAPRDASASKKMRKMKKMEEMRKMKKTKRMMMSSDKRYQVIELPIDKSWREVKKVKEVKRSDGLCRFACGDV